MIYIETDTTLPYMNLAYEEYYLTQSDISEDIFMLWQNEPTIVIGRFQNTLAEINKKYVEDNNIHVVRRISGGGAVYHDFGNLCYTFILNNVTPDQTDFSIFAKPVVKALERIGVNAEISGKNDITIDGQKFSGTAMHLSKNRLLFHGTLLYNSNLSVLTAALNVSQLKIASKGAQSIRSRVTNIKPYLKDSVNILEFKEILKQEIFRNQAFDISAPTSKDIKKIKELAQQRYQNWDWTYGNDPMATLINARRYPGGEVQVYLSLEGGFIKSCKFFGDFLGVYGIESVEQRLKNIKYDRLEIQAVLETVDIKNHFGSISCDQIVDCIMNVL